MLFLDADAFVDLSRENSAVRSVTLAIPFTDPGDDVSGTHDRYAIWEKLLKALEIFRGSLDISICE
jgi:hypothetical protein